MTTSVVVDVAVVATVVDVTVVVAVAVDSAEVLDAEAELVDVEYCVVVEVESSAVVVEEALDEDIEPLGTPPPMSPQPARRVVTAAIANNEAKATRDRFKRAASV